MTNKPLRGMAAACVIFDVDGTLIDSAPDLLGTLNVLMADLGRRPLKLDEVRHAIGHGAKALIRNGAMLTGDALEDAQIDILFEKYLTHYSANIVVKTKPFPGAREVLETLKANGTALAVCTNKLDSLTHRVLEALNLKSYFDVIVASDTFPKMKPDPMGVLEIMKATGATPGTTLFVGDSKTDLDAGRAAGVDVVLVDFGYSKVPVEQLTPDAIISDLRDIL